MARHEDMHDVEMDEIEALPTSNLAAARARLRRSWPLAAGLVAVLLGGLAVTQTVFDARERARLSRVRALPGVVRELDASVHELWRSDAGESSAVTGGALLADRFVGGRLDADGSQSVEALAAQTGATAWSLPVSDADPTTPADAARPPQCLAAQGLAVCLVLDDYAPLTGTIAPTSTAPRRARVVVVDPRTGTLVAEREAASSSTLAVASDLVLVAWVSGDGHGVVTGTEPRTGEVRWTFTTPAPLEARAGERLGLDVTDVGVGIIVGSWSQKLWLLSPDGVLQRELPGNGGSTWFELARVGLLALRTPEGPVGARTTLLVDGRDGPTFDGEPVNLAVDDGSAPGLVFTGGTPLIAWDAATGTRRWRSDADTGRTLVLLDGTLYSATYDSVLALDAATGKVLWTSPVQLKSDLAVPLTDGRVLVVVERVPTSHLVAFDLADGRRLWDAALPAHVDNLQEVHGRAFGTRYTTSGLEVVALG
ncbi:MAG TPA: PQQ-binding-like beta-propeller repeat protein [Cellulomonas sp.]|uniref:outer membrane protein assembly factor BamB family protein n=1 Tax=Cellulomonas sp. TaxID=40001 RepID=UPI002E329560|nr:PQQ-binding-like beta-propeller repeat protein [Cellulomonas sp.]HEX5332084.1 PQQ-binding-like beta-propeller repeat protein [Cellulomonas sp.]